MPRRALVLTGLLILIALACLGAPAGAPVRAEGRTRFIVELAPGGQRDSTRPAALDAVAGVVAAPVTPVYIYRHALDGFALDLTPAEAASVASLPGVARVVPDWTYTLDGDASPPFLGVAQPDLRPALFYARLSGGSGALGRVVARYEAASRTLRFQIFYTGLSGPPTSAMIGKGAVGTSGAMVHDLASDTVGGVGVTGGYVGQATLDAAAEDALFTGKIYITIATGAAPDGELRAQLTASRGAGIVIGVLDTGIDPQHPSFSDQPADGHSYTNPLGRKLGVCSPSDDDGRYDATFPCNNKLIGAYTFADTAGTPDPQGAASPRDNHGHGSHVASIAAGNITPGAAIGGAQPVTVAGVAPHANLIAYDVCGVASSGRSCSGAALLAAIDQALADEVDVLNLSLSGASRDPWAASDTRALLRATGLGSVVTASAGNGGPAAGSQGAPGNAPWVASVASLSHGWSTLNGARVANPAAAGRLDATSARGPDRSVPDLLKPDIAAPGVTVLAAWADVDAAIADYAEVSGTSMAAPQIAGLSALLREIHPDWTPAEIRSALILTGGAASDQYGAPADLFARGGGLAQAGDAAMAGFVLDVGEAAYRAADPSDGGDPSALNLPGLVSQQCLGACVFTRTLRSAVGVPVTWDISGEGDGFTLTSDPAGSLTLAPGAITTVTFTATVTTPQAGALGYGAVQLVAGGGLAPSATMPVAIPLDSSDLPGTIKADPAVPVGSLAVTMRAITVSNLTVTAHGLARVQPRSLSLAADPTPDNYADVGKGGIYQEQVVLPAGNARLMVEVAEATAADIDVIVYQDRAGAGAGALGPEDSVLCQQKASGSTPRCDILASNPLSGRVQPITATLLVQNHQGSGRSRDSLRLFVGQVSAGKALGGLAVSGPKTAAAGKPFDLRIGWSLPGAQIGERYIGLVSLGSAPGAPSNLGTTLLDFRIGAQRTYLPHVRR